MGRENVKLKVRSLIKITHLINPFGFYIYIYIYICVCVCVCSRAPVCICVCVFCFYMRACVRGFLFVEYKWLIPFNPIRSKDVRGHKSSINKIILGNVFLFDLFCLLKIKCFIVNLKTNKQNSQHYRNVYIYIYKSSTSVMQQGKFFSTVILWKYNSSVPWK